MNRLYLSKNLTFLGSLALGAIAATGIATAPAHAGQLGYSNETSDFYDQVVDDTGSFSGNDFSVTFNPDPPGTARVGSATEEFAPFFPTIGDNYGVAEDTVQFDFIGVAGGIATYVLVDDLDFAFDVGPQVTIGAGSTFLAEIDVDSAGNPLGVEFELEIANSATTSVVVGGQTYTLGNPDFPITGEAFEFEDIESVGGGEYAALVSVGETVPEPSAILGFLTIGGLGLGLKRKKQL